MASQVFTTTGSQSWNWPPATTSATAEAIGGGGGGGIASGNPATGGGGKGGSYSKIVITKGAEASLTLVVGTGGAIATAGAASTVVQGGTTVLSAAGGAGGATQATSSANGAGGTTLNGANTGSTTNAGGNGGTGNFTSGTQGSGAGGGAGGPTSVGGAASVNTAGTKGTGTFLDGVAYPGNGAAGVGNSTVGITGPTYGGGASGGKANSGADQNGGVGGQGIIVLTYTGGDQAVTTNTIATSIVVRVPTVASTTTYPLKAAAAFCTAHWTLDETSGQGRVDTRAGLVLAETNGAVPGGAGKFENSAQFSQFTSGGPYLSLPHVAAVSPDATQTWMVRAWVRINAVNAGHAGFIFSKSAGNTDYAFDFQVGTGGGLAFWIRLANGTDYNLGTYTPAIGEWVLVHAYVDTNGTKGGVSYRGIGTAGASIPAAYAPSTTGPLSVGASSIGTWGPSIEVDDLVILKGYRLTNAEMAIDARSGQNSGGLRFLEWDPTAPKIVITSFIAAGTTLSVPAIELVNKTLAFIPSGNSQYAPSVTGGAVSLGITILGPQYGQAASGDHRTATTAPIDTTDASLVIVAVAYYGNDIGGTGVQGSMLASYISDNKGNGTPTALVERRATSGGNNQTGLRVFYWANPTTVGTGHTFNITTSTFDTYPSIIAVALKNVALVSPITVENGNNANGGSLTSVNTGSIQAWATDIALAFINLGQDLSGLTAPSGFTILTNGAAPLVGGAAFGIAMAHRLNVGTVTDPTWTASTDLRSAAIVAVRYVTDQVIHGVFIGGSSTLTTLLQDSFTGSLNTPIRDRPMDVGGGWADTYGTFILNGAGQAISGSNGENITNLADAGYADVTVGLDITANYEFCALSLSVRSLNQQNQWLAAIERDGGTPYLVLVERNSGVNTTRAGGPGVSDVPVAAFTTLRMTVVCEGNSITVSLDSGHSISYTSATFQNTSTLFGLSQYTTSGYLSRPVDNFLVTTLLLGAGASETFAPTVALITTGPQTIIGAFIGGGTLLTSLVSYWKLDESSGNALDAHGTNDLTDVNTVTSTGGKINTGRQFTSANAEAFIIGDNASLSTGDIDFTVQVWVWMDSKSILRCILGRWNGTAKYEYVLLWDSGIDRFRFYVSPDGTAGSLANVIASNFGAPSISTWYCIHIWHDSTANEIGISVNAGTPNTTSHSGGLTDTAATFAIGRNDDGVIDHYFGAMDEVGFWKRVLTSTERAALYNSANGLSYDAMSAAAGASAFAPTVAIVTPTLQTIIGAFIGGVPLLTGLVSYWSMEEAGGATALDAHGTNHLTDIGDFGLPGSATGKVGNARDFEASIYCLLVHADNAALSTGDIDFTFSVWAKFETLSVGSEALIAKDNNGTDREYGLFYWWVDGRPPDQNLMMFWVFQTDGTAVSVTTAGFAPVVDTWYHFIGWHDAVNNQIAIVVNAGTPNVVSHSGGVKDGGADFTIGGWADGNLRVDGLIDEVGFWKRILSSDERAYLYNSGSGRGYADLNTSLGGGAVVFSPTVAPVVPSAQAITGVFIGGGLRTGLASYWKLDEASGDAFDAHGGNHLTDTTNVGTAAGKVGTARLFNLAQWFSHPDNADLRGGDTDFSFSLWVYVIAFGPASYTLVAKVSSSYPDDYEITVGSNTPGQERVYFGIASGDSAIFGAIGFTINTWHHIACGHDAVANQLWLVIDGVARTPQGTFSNVPVSTTDPFLVGMNGFGFNSHRLNGLLDEIGFWKRRLTSTEVAALYNAGAGLSYTAFEGAASVHPPSVLLQFTQTIAGAFIGPGLRNALVSYWKLDEASGDRADSHGSNTLTDNNTVTSDTGKVNSGALFVKANSEYLSHATNADLQTGDVDFTFAFWVKLTTLTADAALVSKDSGATNFRDYIVECLNISGSRQFCFTIFSDTQIRVPSGVVPSTGVWYHVVAWHDALLNQISIAINNGTPTTTNTGGTIQTISNTAFWIGASPPPGTPDYLDGVIDEVSFWKRVLTPAERTALYNGGNGLTYDTFVGEVFPPTVTPGAPGDQAVTTTFIGATSQVFAPTIATLTFITTSTVASATQVFALTVTPGAVTVGAAFCVATSQVFLPTVAPGVVTVTTPGRTTTIQVFAPTIAVGAVTVITPGRPTTIQVFAPVVSAMVLGATIPSGSGVFAPSVIQNVTLAHRPTTIQLFVLSVAPGAVTVTLVHRATTIQVFAPSVAPQPVTITGAFCSTTTQVFAPSLALTVLGATRTSTAVLFPPSLSMSVTTAFIAATTILYPPTVLLAGALGGPTATSTLQVFPPSVVNTLSLVTGAFIGSLQSIAAPSVTTLTFVTLSHRTSTLQIFSPIVAPGAVPVSGATIPAASLCFAPSISTGVAGVGGAFISSTALLRAPSVTTLTFVFTAALASTSQTFAPTIRPGITTGFISSTLDVFPPAVIAQLQVTVGGLTSTARLFPPSVGGFPAGTCATAGLAIRYLVTSATMTHAVLVQGSVAVRYLGTGTITCKPLEAAGDVGVRVIVTASVKVSCCGAGVLP